MAKNGKARLIKSAFKLFLQKGYHGVCIKDIMDATELSKGAVYHHFESKYAIYLATLEEYYFKLIETDFPDDAHLDIRSKLLNRYQRFISLIDFIEHIDEDGIKYPIRAFFQFQLESERDEQVLLRVQKSMDYYRKESTELIASSKKNGELVSPLSADVLAQQVMSMMEGIAIHNSSVESGCKDLLNNQYSLVIDSFISQLTKENIMA